MKGWSDVCGGVDRVVGVDCSRREGVWRVALSCPWVVTIWLSHCEEWQVVVTAMISKDER